MANKDGLYQQIGKYYGLAFLLPTCILVGYVIGYLLDKAFKTHFLYIVFLLFGVAAGIIELIRELNRASDDDARR
jgi:F0F1-type ATP synthase assembly protein I